MHKEEISPRKGGELIDNSFLSDKYILLDVLKDTAATEVLHVRHRSLNTDRILKVIPAGSKESLECPEVSLLKDLRHPSIPIIYDLQYQNNHFVIVEEYIDGQSLKDILLLQNNVSEDFLIWTAKKLCDVMIYLHTREKPILYQDLKPEHIFYQDNELKLIDFGISEFLDSSEVKNHFGTRGYAAPEQFELSALDEGVDIYAFGMVLKEIAAHISSPISAWINALITRSTKSNRDERFSSFNEISEFLFDHTQRNKKGAKDLLLKSIAISGSSAGVGVTHIAISLVCVLRAMGIPAVYKDMSGKNLMLALEKEHCLETKDLYVKKNLFLGELELGPGIDAKTKKCLLVKDYGTDTEKMTGDKCLFIVGGRLWQLSDGKASANRLIDKGNTIIVCNQGTLPIIKQYSKIFKTNIYRFYTDKDPLLPTRKKIRFCKKTLRIRG